MVLLHDVLFGFVQMIYLLYSIKTALIHPHPRKKMLSQVYGKRRKSKFERRKVWAPVC